MTDRSRLVLTDRSRLVLTDRSRLVLTDRSRLVFMRLPLLVVNKSKVLYGLLKEPEISLPADDDDDTEEGDKPKVYHSTN